MTFSVTSLAARPSPNTGLPRDQSRFIDPNRLWINDPDFNRAESTANPLMSRAG